MHKVRGLAGGITSSFAGGPAGASNPAGVTYENRSHWLPFLFLSGWDIEQLWRLAFGCESSQLDHNPETSIKGKINVY
ncbi:MAG: hypothetical protein H6Q21_1344 [Bacteroidetes bacterium]|jgi:hypothetical protein|nr:hypothetical protein [Bacteroidota bacterium]